MTATGYHVSPARNRESITAGGLHVSPVDGRHVWLFASEHDAARHQGKLWDGSRVNDVWAVDLAGLDVFADPHGKAGAVALEGPVPASRVRLHAPAPGHGTAADTVAA